MKHNRLVLVSVAVALLLLGDGCNRGKTLDRQAVSGHVSLNSQPLDQGSIQFSPVDKEGIAGGVSIADGAYQIPKAKGLPPGKYTVRISAAIPGSNAAPKRKSVTGMSPPPLQERIPEQYNSKSQLAAEVESGGANVFDFDLRVGNN